MAPTSTIVVPAGKKVSVQITPLGTPEPLIGRCAGACGAEVTPYSPNDFLTGFMRPTGMVSTTEPTQAELLALEAQLRPYKVELSRTALKFGDGGVAICGGEPWPLITTQGC